ncbi:DNA polymerase I, thermostable [Linum perenne]
MAYHHCFSRHVNSFYRRFCLLRGNLTGTVHTSPKEFQTQFAFAPPTKGFQALSTTHFKSQQVFSASSPANVVIPSRCENELLQETFSDTTQPEGRREDNYSNPSNCRVMLVDGTSIIYRAYYKLLSKLHNGHLSNADGNGDWVLTICSALSLIIDVLEFLPSHVAVVFDYDGAPFDHTCVSSKENLRAKGINFRHNLYPAYKSNRPPTPDTIVQGLQYLKASLKAMAIKVIETPGVEADDVIGTLATKSVEEGFKVRVVSPDKDFFQILSPSLRLLRLVPRGSEMVSFGMEDFAERYGSLKPSQFVDMISLVGDKADNIPGVGGIGDVNALKLITKFGKNQL